MAKCARLLIEQSGFEPWPWTIFFSGYSQKNCVGVCGPLPKTLTLFMTKICDFPYPIYDLTFRSLGEELLLLALSSLC